VDWQDKKTGEISTHAIQHVFIMTGASPGTEWLRGCLALDDKGFILTGRDLEAEPELAVENAASNARDQSAGYFRGG